MRIGIAGTESSHVRHCLHLLNIVQRYRSSRVIALWGVDRERSRTLAKRYNVSTVAVQPTDMVDQVDVVIVADRNGHDHRAHAVPFLEAGVPVFVDKPLACTEKDAKAILAAARASATPVTSYSALRWQPDTERLRTEAAKFGKPRIVITTGRFDPDSPHGGASFYGIHSIELALHLAGAELSEIDVRQADREGAILSALAGHIHVVVGLARPTNRVRVPFHAQIVSTRGTITRSITTGSGAEYMVPVLERVLRMARTGEPPLSPEELLAPVRMLAALGRAYGQA